MAYHHGNLGEALLERAAEVIAERGIEALSLRPLARDLGVSHAAPRAHFADRRALLCELAKEGFRQSVDAMHAGAEAAGPDPVARYRAIGRAYVQFGLMLGPSLGATPQGPLPRHARLAIPRRHDPLDGNGVPHHPPSVSADSALPDRPRLPRDAAHARRARLPK